MPTPTLSSAKCSKDPNRLLSGKRICILDDQKDSIKILEANLSKYGAQTKSFNQAGPALDYLREDPPDLLLLDIMMPEIDGWEFYTTMRGEAGLRTLPVLFVTCLTDHKLEPQMEQDGLCATLSKPIFRDQLIEKIVQLLG